MTQFIQLFYLIITVVVAVLYLLAEIEFIQAKWSNPSTILSFRYELELETVKVYVVYLGQKFTDHSYKI